MCATGSRFTVIQQDPPPSFNIPASGRESIHKFQDPYFVLEIHSFMKLTSAVKYLMAKKFYESENGIDCMFHA